MTNKSKNAVISKKDDKVVSMKERSNGIKKNLVKEMETLQEKLDKQIRNFTHKSQMIHNRQQFLETKKELEEFISGQGADFDEFMSDSGKQIVLKDENGYGRDGISIKNNLLVREFVECLVKRIDVKISEIEKEIVA